MFDSLVESQKQKKGRTRGFFLSVMLVYALLLLGVGIFTVFWFNPTLTDQAELTAMLAPPPPPPPPPPPAEAPKQVIVKEAPTTFTPPTTPPKEIPKATDVKSKPQIQAAVVSGGVPGGTGVPGGVAGAVGKGDDDPPPPPPPPAKPTPTPEAKPTPPPPPKKINVSGGVLSGSAIRKPQPPYPPIAKAARAQGAVQVAVDIDEDGNVTSASAVSGHPLLREAAVQAARQWKFRPTLLSGVPVKVQGVLTFNFTLQ